MKTLLLFLLCAFTASAQMNLGKPAFLALLNRTASSAPTNSGFVPSDYGTVQVWYSARVGGATNVPNNTGTNHWYDLSGNQFDAIQATANAQPNRVTNGMNGVAAWAFDGNATFPDWMSISNCLQGLTTGATLMMSLQLTNDPAADTGSSGMGKFGSVSGSGNHWPFTDGNIYDGFGITSRVTVGNPARSMTNAVIVCITVAPNDYKFYIDNVLIGSSSSVTMGWSTTPIIGIDTETPAYLRGLMTDLVIWSVKLGDSNRTNANNTLAPIIGSQIN